MMGSNLDSNIASILSDKEFMQETVQVYSCLLNSSSVMRYTKSPLLLKCKEFDDPEFQIQHILSEQLVACQGKINKYLQCKEGITNSCIKNKMKATHCMTSEARKIISDGKIS